jgi:hypothetical protein
VIAAGEAMARVVARLMHNRCEHCGKDVAAVDLDNWRLTQLLLCRSCAERAALKMPRETQ